MIHKNHWDYFEFRHLADTDGKDKISVFVGLAALPELPLILVFGGISIGKRRV